MKILIDTNILLDVLQRRMPHLNDSLMIWKLCETKQVSGSVSALSAADLVYIMRKELNAEKTFSTLKKLSMIFQFEDLAAHDLEKAAALCWDDFEDAVQSVTADRIEADYIITRNTKDYSASNVPAITPEQFLEIIRKLQ